MKLLVDSREPPGLIELLKVRVKNIEFGNLDIGDFIIKTDNDETIMIFERKSLNDLLSSIKDGRYTEQSFRLSQSPLDNHSIYYVIEGNISEFITKNNETTRKMLFSSMLSLSYVKGFSLLRTSGWLETAEIIIRFMEKLGDGKTPLKIQNQDLKNAFSENAGQYTDVIKTAKKANITKDNIGEIMLAQIPGLSMNVAQSLMVKYKTIKNLIIALEKDENCLNDFKVDSKSGMRKLSKPVIQNLKDYL
jgi:crossover junction endonuclease MUS81